MRGLGVLLFSHIHLLFVMKFSHLNFYSELLSIRNSRVMKVQSWFIRWYVDTMIQNSNYQAENDQNSSLCTPLVPNKETQWSLDKRQRFCCDDHARRPKSPNPSSNKIKKNMTRQKINKTHHCVLLWCQTKRGNALSTRGKGSAVMIMQIASHRIHWIIFLFKRCTTA